eukprot:CAMPEP_0182426666 /NCGR_PEP_ID=MMETSP1167-20130531/13178_1 /TAXON_ID=2988 /ORGANISM="Mallomonas Sp, Strain CCMP3275" /LENGTH=668 /DNA_ID=CAMNT_0024608273 /DNA_START=139 /DNA_END=2145 /DNA_ORIENTATION=+
MNPGIVIAVAVSLSVFFVFFIANNVIVEVGSGKEDLLHLQRHSINRGEYISRLQAVQESLEDGKEVLRDVLYRQSLRAQTPPLHPTNQAQLITVSPLLDSSKNYIAKSSSVSDTSSSLSSRPPPPPPPPSTDLSHPPVSLHSSRDTHPDAQEAPSLPGADSHPILRMTEQEFRHTPVNEMMVAYGEALGGGTCANDFGNSLVDRWRNTKKPYCTPQSPPSSLPPFSSIDCYLVSQTRHHGHGDNLCHLHNVSYDMSIFARDPLVRPVVEKYVNTRHADQPYVHFPPGFLTADCEVVKDRWQEKYMPGWNADLTVKAYKQVSPGALHPTCEQYIDHNILMIQRDTFANFFHDSEDLVNAFLSLAILKWKLSDTQLYFTDLYPEGPFWSIWQKAFSSHSPPAHSSTLSSDALSLSDPTVGGPLTAWDLRQLYGPHNKRPAKKTCFRSVAVGIYGPAAPMTVASWNTPCSHTALIRAYSDFVIRGLNLQTLTHYAQSSPSKTVQVTYMARRASTVWPEKKFCNDTSSFFLCRLWDGQWGIRKLGRMLKNEEAVLKALKGLETRSYLNNAHVVVRDVDYNKLSMEEQITVDLQTDIMVGPHGAGLMHNIFMRDRAVLVEMHIDGSGANRHFHNLAHWYGRKYIGQDFSQPVNTELLSNLIAGAIESMDLNAY